MPKTPKPIIAYAIIKNNKLPTYEIYDTDDIVLEKDEKIIRVIITPYEKQKRN